MPDAPQNNDPATDLIEAEIVKAEMVPPALTHEGASQAAVASNTAAANPPSHGESLLDTNVDRLSAKGGAIGGLLLAVLGSVGMAFSSYSLFNVLLAILFSIWGMKSPLRKTAMAGLMIALVGLIAFFARLGN